MPLHTSLRTRRTTAHCVGHLRRPRARATANSKLGHLAARGGHTLMTPHSWAHLHFFQCGGRRSETSHEESHCRTPALGVQLCTGRGQSFSEHDPHRSLRPGARVVSHRELPGVLTTVQIAPASACLCVTCHAVLWCAPPRRPLHCTRRLGSSTSP